jgi:hypothetical protein
MTSQNESEFKIMMPKHVEDYITWLLKCHKHFISRVINDKALRHKQKQACQEELVIVKNVLSLIENSGTVTEKPT